MDGKKRARSGALTSILGVVLNLALAAFKLAVGIIFGIVSVVADGFNNLSDCGSGVVSLVSFGIAEKPADVKHPYGHRRAEYIASMIIGCLVLFVAAELLRGAVVEIAAGEVSEDSYAVYTVLGVSVAVKAVMFLIYSVQAKRLGSDALHAVAIDSACDCLSTLAVIAGLLVTRFTGVNADGWVGALVSVFIGWQGIAILREAGSKLLGQGPEFGLVNSLRAYILSEKGVIGIHDLRVYVLGRDLYVGTVHVEMDASLPALSAHAVLDKIEHNAAKDFGVDLTAHLDPVDLEDAEAFAIEDKVRVAVEGMAEGLELHDFRLVRGIEKKLIFEAGVPFSCPHTDAELKERICSAVRGVCDCTPEVKVERED